MEVYDAIKKRRSVRKFQNKEIPQEIIDKLSEALVWAPSAGNLQSRKFYFVFNKDVKKKLAEAANRQQPVMEAPLAIVCCADEQSVSKYGERGKNLYAICDVAASIENLMILAVDFSLATVWMGAFDENKVKSILELPENLRPVAIVPVGYPGEFPDPPSRTPKEKAINII